ncbi:hypothetical protein CR513_12385, partial [Mucuna pruriens]
MSLPPLRFLQARRIYIRYVVTTLENKDKKGKSKEKDHDDDDRVITAIGDDLVILRDFDGVALHVTPRKEFFTSYTVDDFGVLKMGNDGVTKAIGVADICLQTNMVVQLWLPWIWRHLCCTEGLVI